MSTGNPNNYCPLGLLCGRRLKSDVRSSEMFGFLATFVLARRALGHIFWVHILTEETKVLILGPSHFSLCYWLTVPSFLLVFSKTAKKSTSGIWR